MADVETREKAKKLTLDVVEKLQHKDFLTSCLDPIDVVGLSFTMQLRVYNGKEFVTVRVNSRTTDNATEIAEAVAHQFKEYKRLKNGTPNARGKSKG